jgi:hypothetical protein
MKDKEITKELDLNNITLGWEWWVFKKRSQITRKNRFKRPRGRPSG